jgi:hypothetical protein
VPHGIFALRAILFRIVIVNDVALGFVSGHRRLLLFRHCYLRNCKIINVNKLRKYVRIFGAGAPKTQGAWAVGIALQSPEYFCIRVAGTKIRPARLSASSKYDF